MKLTKINEWLRKGEGPNIDFKLQITSPQKIARSITAFANSRGGILLVGINDQKQIIGVNTSEEEYELELASQNFCQPAIPLYYEEVLIQNKTILVAEVPESNNKPHHVLDKNGKQTIYVRLNDECVVATPKIKTLLAGGELNNLHRNLMHYNNLKKEIAQYLLQHKNINVHQYCIWKNCLERNAQRTLFDLLLEGILHTNNESDFTLNPKYKQYLDSQ